MAARQQSRNEPLDGNDGRIRVGDDDRCGVSDWANYAHVKTWLVTTLLTLSLLCHAAAQSGRSRGGTMAGQPRVAERPRQTTNLPIPPPPPVQPPVTQTPAEPSPVADTASTQADIEGDEVIDVRSNLVPVATSVVDAQGAPLLSLGIKDFELLIDGQPKPIADVSRSETPVKMAMLFDNSASLTRARDLEKNAAVRFFARVMRPSDQAAIFSVTHNVRLEQPLTNNVASLVRTIERFAKPEGATSLLDAVAEAAAYLKTHTGRKVIVIVSDGVDTTSRIEFGEALRRAQGADCQVYAVQTGQSTNANLRDLVAERRLHEFAVQTGGAVFAPLTTEDLDRAFTQVAADLAQQYILSYYPSCDPPDGRFRRIAVRVLNNRNVRVRNRSGYYAPKS